MIASAWSKVGMPPRWRVLSLFGAGLLLANPACRCGSPAAEGARPSTWRLIDHTTEQSITVSPMRDVEASLDELEQRLGATDLTPITDPAGRDTWVACLSPPPLVGLADQPPIGMTLQHEGTPIPHGAAAGPPSYSYDETRLVLQADFRRGPDDPPLTEDDRALSSEWIAVLPGSPLNVDLRTTRGHALAGEHQLLLRLDGDTIATLDDLGEDGVQVHHHTTCGSHRLELTLVQPPNPSARRDPRFLPMVRVEVTSSGGLLHVIPDGSWPLAQADLIVRWLGDEPRTGAGELAALARRWPLADPGVGEDVHGSKKKLSTPSSSRNVLFAPTPGELVYGVQVPEGGRLRVGGGVLRPRRDEIAADAVFEVLVEAGGIRQTAWTRTTAEPFEDIVDLSPYAGQRVELILETTAATGVDARHLASYWADPQVYRPLAEGEPRPPNVVLVSVDTLGARHLSLHGYTRATSPNLVDLAADATVFHAARSQYPTTAVSHMSMFTSHYPHRSARALHVDSGVGHGDGALAEPTLAGLLREAGWVTAAITGGGALHHTLGFDHGFDTYASCDADDSAGALADRAGSWIRGHADQPFFLFLHTYQVHGPYAPPAPYNASFTSSADPFVSLDPMAWLEPGESCRAIPQEHHPGLVALYDGEILYTDEQLLAPLVSLLKELRLYDDTLLIVTSDHGEEFAEHGCWTHGANLYDETLHVPLVIRFPHGAHAGEAVREVVRLVDLVPTVLAVAGVPVTHSIDGRDLVDLLRGGPGEEAVSMRLTQVDLPGEPGRVAIEQVSLVHGTHKLIVSEHPRARLAADGAVTPDLELFDLSTDPGEHHDLATERPGLAEELLLRARSYYDPDEALGVVGAPGVGATGMQWKEHMRGLGYLDAVE